MKSLIKDLESKVGKQAYQTYSISHGIEQFDVLIPLAQARTFEEEFDRNQTRSKKELLELVFNHSGKIKG